MPEHGHGHLNVHQAPVMRDGYVMTVTGQGPELHEFDSSRLPGNTDFDPHDPSHEEDHRRVLLEILNNRRETTAEEAILACAAVVLDVRNGTVLSQRSVQDTKEAALQAAARDRAAAEEARDRSLGEERDVTTFSPPTYLREAA